MLEGGARNPELPEDGALPCGGPPCGPLVGLAPLVDSEPLWTDAAGACGVEVGGVGDTAAGAIGAAVDAGGATGASGTP